MSPLVSILIPAYNAEACLAETIESALEQTYPNKEIIVVDDGSKDGTLQLARKFADRGVIAVGQANAGAAAARNKAYSLCRGDFIQWLDADDLLSADKITLQMRAFSLAPNQRKLLSSAWGYFIKRPGNASFIPTALWEDLSPLEWLVRKLELNLHMQTATWLVSRQLCEAAGPWDARLLGDDDGEYFCRVLLASEGVVFVPGARVFYRRSISSLSYIGSSTRKMEAQFLSMKSHVANLLTLENSSRVRAACVKYLQRYLIYFYPELPQIVRQAHDLAGELGGALTTPTLPIKYRWIQKIFGWRLGKLAWVILPKFKESLTQRWDKMLFALERRSASKVSGPACSSRHCVEAEKIS